MSNEVVIVGAGAAGLSIAYHLKQLDIPFLIIEKGEAPATTWASMPDHLKLISTWRCNSLLKEEPLKYDRSYRMPAKDYAEYLKSFAHQNQFTIQTKTEVQSLEKNHESFVLKTNQGEILSKNVIVSTGYFNTPIIPQSWDTNDCQIPLIPFSQFKNAQDLKAKDLKKILVVGKRLSAGQAIYELVQAGIETHISIRSPLKFMAHPLIFNFSFKYLCEIESLPLALNPRLNVNPDIKMESGIIKKVFDQGLVLTKDEIVAINGDTVQFKSGHYESYDAILLATGFHPTYQSIDGIPTFEPQNLREQFQHPTIDNLYLLGIQNQYNYRSRFLRGMREDALILAQRLNANSSLIKS